MGGELKYEIAQNAYIKLVLHALKHKTAAVNGVLVGRLVPSTEGSHTVQISDAVPLFHSQISLLPALEISLIQVFWSRSPIKSFPIPVDEGNFFFFS